MLIAYVGNFTQSHCTEVHLAATLEDLGHIVTRFQEDDPKTRFELRNQVRGHDMLLWTRTWPGMVDPRGLGVPTVSYHLDLYVGIKRQDGLDNDPFWRTDFVFTPDGDPRSAEIFKFKGINHFYMPPGVYKPECYKGTPRPEFACDVLFVGGGIGYHTEDWPYRAHLVTWLRNTYGPRYKKFGNPEPTIRNAALNDLYASAKVVVGDSLCTNFTHERYWSDRVTETTGRGGFLIHPHIVGLEDEFEPNKEMVFYSYGDFGQLKELIDYYVEHDDERETIRDAGHVRTKDTHTYNDRLAQMMATVFP